MPRIEQSTTIAVPVADVYSMLVNEPERMPEWWPTVEVHTRVTPPPTQVGSLFRYVYNIAGVRVKGELRIVALEPGIHIRFKTTSGIDSTFYINLSEDQGRAARVTIIGDFQLPSSVLGQLLNRTQVAAETSDHLAQGLDNLRKMLEANAHRNG